MGGIGRHKRTELEQRRQDDWSADRASDDVGTNNVLGPHNWVRNSDNWVLRWEMLGTVLAVVYPIAGSVLGNVL